LILIITLTIPILHIMEKEKLLESEANFKSKLDSLLLSSMEVGSRGIVKNFLVKCEDEKSCRMAHRLKEMGLYEGAKFEVMQNHGRGELSLLLDGTKLVLGRGMADKISVELTETPSGFFEKFFKKVGFKYEQ